MVRIIFAVSAAVLFVTNIPTARADFSDLKMLHEKRLEVELKFSGLITAVDWAELPDAYEDLAWEYIGVYSRASKLAKALENNAKAEFCSNFADPGSRYKNPLKAAERWKSSPMANDTSLKSLNEESVAQWSVVSDYCADKMNVIFKRVPMRNDALSALIDIESVSIHAVNVVLDADIDNSKISNGDKGQLQNQPAPKAFKPRQPGKTETQ